MIVIRTIYKLRVQILVTMLEPYLAVNAKSSGRPEALRF